ncbi:MAG: alpha/beta hydrolase [Burkholderiaceae bacterium]|nr:alpha/beta hydrolase [Burkholderiaceae bacterium]
MNDTAIAEPEVHRIDDDRGPALEMLHLPATAATRHGPPILLVHGAYTDAWSWAETFMPYFASLGYPCWAPTLRGRGASDGGAALDAWGLSDYLNDVSRAQACIGEVPILIGASMGGLLVQRWLSTRRDARACVLIGSIPPVGMTAALMRMAFGAPRDFFHVMQLAVSGNADRRFVDLLAKEPIRTRRRGFYRDHLYRESSRALWELTWLPMVMPTHGVCPVLAMHGEQDRLVPPASVESIASYFDARVMMLPDTGHAPMLEKNWIQTAEKIAEWITQVLDTQRNANEEKDP